MADSKLARTEHNMVIVEKLKKLEDDQTGLVAVINDIFKILWDDGLVYELKVAPEKVGPHKTNRGGTGVCERIVHQLLKNITDTGYSDDATDPWAIEDDHEGTNRKFVHDLSKLSAKLATLPHTTLASLSNGHTNHALCCARAGVECDIPELSTRGIMCKAKIVGRCPSIETPINEGLTWKILRSKVAVLYPTLIPSQRAIADGVLGAPPCDGHRHDTCILQRSVRQG